MAFSVWSVSPKPRLTLRVPSKGVSFLTVLVEGSLVLFLFFFLKWLVNSFFRLVKSLFCVCFPLCDLYPCDPAIIIGTELNFF